MIRPGLRHLINWRAVADLLVCAGWLVGAAVLTALAGAGIAGLFAAARPLIGA